MMFALRFEGSENNVTFFGVHGGTKMRFADVRDLRLETKKVLGEARVLSAEELRGILAGADALRDLEMEHHLEVAEDEKGS
ncbi:MAG: hypothetical protein HY039_09810 [Nitrospirae bacterium]|nr:hypothetical protein [Nitrospirota bacterium]